jgi:integrase
MIEIHFKYLSPSYKQRSVRRLELYIFPWLGEKPVSEITPRDLLDIFRRIENANKSPTVKKTREVVNLVFKHALVTGRIMHNPCEATRGIIKISRPKHMAA